MVGCEPCNQIGTYVPQVLNRGLVVGISPPASLENLYQTLSRIIPLSQSFAELKLLYAVLRRGSSMVLYSTSLQWLASMPEGTVKINTRRIE